MPATRERNALNSELVAVADQSQHPKRRRLFAWPASSTHLPTERELVETQVSKWVLRNWLAPVRPLLSVFAISFSAKKHPHARFGLCYWLLSVSASTPSFFTEKGHSLGAGPAEPAAPLAAERSDCSVPGGGWLSELELRLRPRSIETSTRHFTMEDQAKPPVDLTNFIDTLKSLTNQAALLQGMPEVQNGARLESAVNGVSKRVDTLGEQMGEVMGTLQAIERRLAELTELRHRAGPNEAPLAGDRLLERTREALSGAQANHRKAAELQMPAKSRLLVATRRRNALNSDLIAVADQPQRPQAAACLAWPASSALVLTEPELLVCNLGYKVGPPQLARAAAASVSHSYIRTPHRMMYSTCSGQH
ncbi:hypothetical protein PCL_00458 [Purpureocillium lilacinum]|uniref:Uncharacterized protein n=1 Tax=Purpureocillium lilacinum TaxID=33203 RepID=A0A2U3DP33_PURLI|nr:hypothetical protein PCL_00458 [Purpureocillium lilacinum]